MLVEKIYTYPIKSFRGYSSETAVLTKHGLKYDRHFMILQVIAGNDGSKTYKNMSIAHYNQMCRFFQTINESEGSDGRPTLTIRHEPTDGSESQTLEIPLEPDTSRLDVMDVMMHLSPVEAYRMPDNYNEWLSSCFGFECVLAYIGENTREVRMSSPSYNETSTGSGWLSSLSSIASKASSMVAGSGTQPKGITFSDVAPYLFASSKSMEDVHRRLPEGEQYDITKFRPNVIVSGAEKPWEEDYWGELRIGKQGIRVDLEHNCARCKSINIDYDTGAQGTGEAGTMLKKLSSDRRVDAGSKWSPIFGRYAFSPPESEGAEIRVGQEVKVTRVNEAHTAFGKHLLMEATPIVADMPIDWNGLSTLPGLGRS